MVQPLYCSAADAGLWGERGYGDVSTLYVWLSCIALLPWLPSFPPQAFPITISFFTSSRFISTQSTAPLTLGLLYTPQIPAPSHCTFQGTLVPVQAMYGCVKDCLILIPFRLPQISCFTLSLKCFSSDSDNCPHVGIGSLLQFPNPPRAGPVLLTLVFFSLVPSSYQVLRGSTIFFSTGQVLLSALSWCPACTSVSEGVFLMCLWRQMYSKSTCSSIILFSFSHLFFFFF